MDEDVAEKVIVDIHSEESSGKVGVHIGSEAIPEVVKTADERVDEADEAEAAEVKHADADAVAKKHDDVAGLVEESVAKMMNEDARLSVSLPSCRTFFPGLTGYLSVTAADAARS